ncbi:MAG: nuclear transport factor 2 family protein [Acidobacteria bacterium]|nr:nuclear transport factor 2 family protein [Acidobacteriota bacterium]
MQKIISEYFAAIRAMDCARWVATFAEDAVSYDPADSPPVRGHENLRRFFTAVTAAFQKVGLTEDHVFVVGNSAAVKWTGQGTGRNGRDVGFAGIDIIEVNPQGKIQTVRAYWDMAGMLARLQE